MHEATDLRSIHNFVIGLNNIAMSSSVEIEQEFFPTYFNFLGQDNFGIDVTLT